MDGIKITRRSNKYVYSVAHVRVEGGGEHRLCLNKTDSCHGNLTVIIIIDQGVTIQKDLGVICKMKNIVFCKNVMHIIK